MKLEVGKTYISKLGTKVKIVSDEGIAPFQFIGVLDSGCPTTFSEDGENHILAIELEKEFKEKPVFNFPTLPWMKFAAQDKDGRWFMYTKKPKTDRISWYDGGVYILIPNEFAPTYNGDWEDSLVEL